MKLKFNQRKVLSVFVLNIVVGILLAGCSLKPAPFTPEAEQKLLDARKKVSMAPSAPTATKEGRFADYIIDMRNLFKKGGYDLDKTIEQVAVDYDKIVAEKKEENFVVMSILTISRGCSSMNLDLDKLFPKSTADAVRTISKKMTPATAPAVQEKK